MKATCYHARGNDGSKIIGGTISADSLDTAADIICKGHGFTLSVTNSGRVTFMRAGKPVYVYLSVDPALSEQGRAVLAKHRAERREVEEREEQARKEAIDELEGIDPRELLRAWKESKVNKP